MQFPALFLFLMEVVTTLYPFFGQMIYYMWMIAGPVFPVPDRITVKIPDQDCLLFPDLPFIKMN